VGISSPVSWPGIGVLIDVFGFLRLFRYVYAHTGFEVETSFYTTNGFAKI
jgi:hypothetical protein